MTAPLAPQHRAAVSLGAKCRKCPLYDRHEGPVMGVVRPSGKLTVVGEAPATAEVEQGEPFVSHGSGGMLDEALGQNGLTRSDCTLTYSVLCRPPGGDMTSFLAEFRRKQRKLAKGERTLLTPQEACFPRLQADLHAAPSARTLLAVGNEGLKALSKHLHIPFHRDDVAPDQPRATTIKKQHGSPILLTDGRTLMSSLHPAFAQHGKPEFGPVVRHDFLRAAQVAVAGGQIAWREPEFLLSSTFDTTINVLDLLRRSGQLTTIDIETDGIGLTTARIRCIGIGATVNGYEIVIVVPLEQMYTRIPWWGEAENLQIRHALTALLETNQLSGHNLMFDTGVLLSHGLMLNRAKLWMDTLIGHHDTRNSELPHDLGFVAARNFIVPRWKEDADSKVVKGVSDYWLHKYCVDGATRVVLADGSTREIQEIVQKRQPVHVMSMNAAGVMQPREVTDWLRLRVPHQRWVQIQSTATRAHERGIIATPEHGIFTTRGKIRADEVRCGDELLYPEAALTAEQRQAILGTLLGDSSLTVSPHYRKCRLDAPVAQLQGHHAEASGLAQKKVEALEGLAFLDPVIAAHSVEIAGRCGQAGAAQPFRINSMIQLAEIQRLVYDAQGRRRMHREVLDQLGPIGLAWWFMDDGCRQNGGRRLQNDGSRGGALRDPDSVAFSTQGFPREDIDSAVAWFRERYGSTWAGADGVIRLGYTAAHALCREIAPYVFPAQRYKLPRNVRWPSFRRWPKAVKKPHTVRVMHVGPYQHPTRYTKARLASGRVARYRNRHESEIRYCLTVEENHNFFTTAGLVANCAKDVLGEMRLAPVIAQQIQQDGQLGAYSTDIQLAPIARDMTILGLPINEKRRRDYFHTFTAAATKKKAEVRTIVGDADFNPNSTRQVADFLFLKQGLTPTYGGGQEWADFVEEIEEEDLGIDLDDPETLVAKATTDEPALLRLQELGVDSKSNAFIEALLGFRAMQKTNTALGLKYEDDKIVDIYRRRGHLTTESHGSALLSILHPSWKLHVTPTGRWASQPNVQNISERIVYDVELYRATGGKEGIINLRNIFEAPEGYSYVGADYSQIELRLYAAKAHDALLLEALAKGIDPHAWNYSSMMARSAADLLAGYEKVKNADAKIKKHLRNIAKRFCIAEDEPVLVRRGAVTTEVPIQDVACTDEVWDGVEWVTHDGVVLLGTREVIEHDGLWATEDHEVWFANGERGTHKAGAGRALLRSGEAGRPLRVVADHRSELEGERTLEGGGALHGLSARRDGLLGELARGEVVGLRLVSATSDRDTGLVARPFVVSAVALHESEASELGGLRGPGDSILLPLDPRGSGLRHGDDRAASGAGVGPDRHERILRAGKPALGDESGTADESPLHEAPNHLGLPAERVASDEEGCREEAPAGHDTRSDPTGGTGVRGTARELVEERRRTVRVYDLVNAGPRHRFTVRGRLVSNCYLIMYGGHKEKLAKTMRSDRNPDGSLSFPGLLDAEVAFWFDNWHKLHPETKAWQQRTIGFWSQHGFVETILDGRRRYFLGGMDETAIPNMTIQGSAAAIANRAMLGIAAECPHRGWGTMAGPAFQCHDELVVAAPFEYVSRAEALLHKCMPWTDPADGMQYPIEQYTRKTLAGG